MIIGLGIDVVDVARFERAMARTPRLGERLFAPEELTLGGEPRPLRSLAARFAAKEAAAKALGATSGMRWVDIVVVQDSDGDPSLDLRGSAAEVFANRNAASAHVSLSHDAGVAVAVVVVEA